MRTFAGLLMVLFLALGIVSYDLPKDFPKEYVIFFAWVCFLMAIYVLNLAEAGRKTGMPHYENPPSPPKRIIRPEFPKDR